MIKCFLEVMSTYASVSYWQLTNIWKYDRSDKIKQEFFQTVAVSVLLYGCTTWIETKHLEKRLDEKYTRIAF